MQSITCIDIVNEPVQSIQNTVGELESLRRVGNPVEWLCTCSSSDLRVDTGVISPGLCQSLIENQITFLLLVTVSSGLHMQVRRRSMRWGRGGSSGGSRCLTTQPWRRRGRDWWWPRTNRSSSRTWTVVPWSRRKRSPWRRRWRRQVGQRGCWEILPVSTTPEGYYCGWRQTKLIGTKPFPVWPVTRSTGCCSAPVRLSGWFKKP